MTANVRTQPRSGELPVASPRVQVRALSIFFLVVLLDGLDTTSISFVAPAISDAWGLAAAAFTPAFVATSVGAVIGYMASGPLARRIGQRAVGTMSVALFGIVTLLTISASDVASLSFLRLVAAVGLGGALPIAITASAGVVSPDRRTSAAMLAATGFAAGSVVGGLLGGPLIGGFGWQAVFLVGGALPLLLLPAFAHVLSAREEPAGRGDANPITALFRYGLGTRTVLLWCFAFLVFLVAYGLAYWIPTLLTEVGFSTVQAPLGAAAFGLGGLIGSVVIVALTRRLAVGQVLILAAIVAITCLVLLGWLAASPALVLPLVFGTGAGLIGSSIGQSAVAISMYSPGLRATGVGWAAASGRIGSIIGPAVGGTMLAMGLPAREIALVAVLPAAAAVLVLAGLVFVDRGDPSRRPVHGA
jgi:MFS transporter, AAHS family, 4-hydroxybenzoate transporter